MKAWVIYTLEDPRIPGERYVGVTCQRPKARLSGHLSLARKQRKYHLTAWLGSLLDAGVRPLMCVVETGAGPAWGAAEAKWIKHFRGLGRDLTNATAGGEGCPGHSVSAEARARIAAARRGKPLSEEHRRKVAEGNRGKRISPEAVAKTASFWRGRKHSDATKSKISAAAAGRTGVVPSAETLAKRSASIKLALAAKRAAGWTREPLTEEHKAKIRAGRQGKTHSVESRAKMSASHRARMERACAAKT